MARDEFSYVHLCARDINTPLRGLVTIYKQLRDSPPNKHTHRSINAGKITLVYSNGRNFLPNGTGEVSVSIEKKITLPLLIYNSRSCEIVCPKGNTGNLA